MRVCRAVVGWRRAPASPSEAIGECLFVFTSLFNYLPLQPSGEHLNVPTPYVTALNMTYFIGIFMGPLAVGMSNRVGNGPMIAGGSPVFSLAPVLTLVPSVIAVAVAVALAGACAGYFAMHAATVGAQKRHELMGQDTRWQSSCCIFSSPDQAMYGGLIDRNTGMQPCLKFQQQMIPISAATDPQCHW